MLPLQTTPTHSHSHPTLPPTPSLSSSPSSSSSSTPSTSLFSPPSLHYPYAPHHHLTSDSSVNSALRSHTSPTPSAFPLPPHHHPNPLPLPPPPLPPPSSSSSSSSTPLSPPLPLHITGLQVFDPPLTRLRGFLIKRGLLQTLTSSPSSSDASPLSASSPSPSSAATPTTPTPIRTPGPTSSTPHPTLPPSPPPLPNPFSAHFSSSTSSLTSSTTPHSSSSPSPPHLHTSPVLIKTFTTAHPSPSSITLLRFEFLAFQRLAGDLSRPLAMVSHEEEGLCLLYEDCGGVIIDRILYDFAGRGGKEGRSGGGWGGGEASGVGEVGGRSGEVVPAAPMSPSSPSAPRPSASPASHHRSRDLQPLSCILLVARALADHLSRLHAAGVIYKALRPSSVLFNADTGRVVLLEYHSSSLLSRERPFMEELGGGEGGKVVVAVRRMRRRWRSSVRSRAAA